MSYRVSIVRILEKSDCLITGTALYLIMMKIMLWNVAELYWWPNLWYLLKRYAFCLIYGRSDCFTAYLHTFNSNLLVTEAVQGTCQGSVYRKGWEFPLIPWDLNALQLTRDSVYVPPGIIWCMCPANERSCYIVTPSLIGWTHTQIIPVPQSICSEAISHEILALYWKNPM